MTTVVGEAVRARSAARLPRDLHPVAWWLWACGLAAAASLTTNPVVLLLLVVSATVVVLARRSDQPWARVYWLYLGLGVAIVAIRLVFRVLLGGADGHVLVWLPEIPLPSWVLGIRLLGPVTRESLLAGLYDGLRLAAIVVSLGAANALANPKRLLRSVPPALYEIGTALVVAVTVLPQLADSLRRVRHAQQLRGVPARRGQARLGRLRRVLVPVLEDALERSLTLAAGMDVRGYGRAGEATRRQRRVTGLLRVAGLGGIIVGTYAVLDQTAPRWLAAPMLAVGALVAGAGLISAGQRVRRTRYRPDPWAVPEAVVIASGLLVGVLGWWVARHDLAAAYPSLSGWPAVHPLSLLAVVIATVPAVAAPEPLLAFVPGERR
ncbi:MAG: energy-coupling factor transporter transmembrane component T [Nocardioides sp.]